jgi:hypothetical protein
MGTRTSFPVAKQPRREADSFLTSGPVIKYQWKYRLICAAVIFRSCVQTQRDLYRRMLSQILDNESRTVAGNCLLLKRTAANNSSNRKDWTGHIFRTQSTIKGGIM